MWAEYRKTRPFNTQELQLAAIAHVTHAAAGGEAPLEDFIPSAVLSKVVKEPNTETSASDLELALKGMFK